MGSQAKRITYCSPPLLDVNLCRFQPKQIKERCSCFAGDQRVSFLSLSLSLSVCLSVSSQTEPWKRETWAERDILPLLGYQSRPSSSSSGKQNHTTPSPLASTEQTQSSEESNSLLWNHLLTGDSIHVVEELRPVPPAFAIPATTLSLPCINCPRERCPGLRLAWKLMGTADSVQKRVVTQTSSVRVVGVGGTSEELPRASNS